MASNEKMWALMVYINENLTSKSYQHKMSEAFEDSFWDYIVEESAKAGVNTILLDICDGIEFGSHPEIATEGAWTRRRVRKEIEKCKKLGIRIIPKLNFSTGHCYWLGEYRHMISTTEYYKLCNDLIKETYELFQHPEYIHIGLDEEDARHVAGADLAVYRQKDLYWHDTRFLIDCVADTGAKPWIWSCPLLRHPEEFKKHIDPDEVLISPWQYFALYPEHYTRIDSDQEFIDYYSKPPYKDLNLTYVEDEPYLVMYRDLTLPLMKEEGYDYVPCMSVYNGREHNTPDTFRYFTENAPDNQIVGYLHAPWCWTIWKNKEKIDETLRLFKESKEKYYG